jgi:hypothetical protein
VECVGECKGLRFPDVCGLRSFPLRCAKGGTIYNVAKAGDVGMLTGDWFIPHCIQTHIHLLKIYPSIQDQHPPIYVHRMLQYHCRRPSINNKETKCLDELHEL